MDDGHLQKRIGEVARAAREGLGLTQKQVADKAGLSPPVYGRLERGLMMPSCPSLRRIALALDVPPSALLDISPEELPTSTDDFSPSTRKLFATVRTWPESKIALAVEMLRLLEPVQIPDE